MFKYPYLLVKNRLSTQIPALKEIAYYMGQGTAQYPGGQLVLPACYIRFRPTQLQSLPGGVQEAVLRFDVITVTENLHVFDDRVVNDVSDDFSEAFSFATADHFDYVARVARALIGFSGFLSDIPTLAALKSTPNDRSILDTIDREAVEPDHSATDKLTTVQTFFCHMKDYSAHYKISKVVADLEVLALEICPNP